YNRDAPELQRRAQKRGAHRLTVLIEIVAAYRGAGEPDGVRDHARESERGGEDLAYAYGARRTQRSLGGDFEFIAHLKVTAHVDAILVDVSECPGKLPSSRGRQSGLCARIHRVIQIRADFARYDDRIGGPGQPLLRTDPSTARASETQRSIHGQVERDLERGRVRGLGRDRDGHAGRYGVG